MTSSNISQQVSDYYTNRVQKWGSTAAGVDWSSEESQYDRFYQLIKLTIEGQKFSILDYGCGYGALVDYLRSRKLAFSYQGYDIAEEMIRRARITFAKETVVRFSNLRDDLEQADFAVASGIFNVRLKVDRDTWESYVKTELDELNSLSRSGFAFNILSSYSDADRQRNDLYYADPLMFFDYCKRRYSKNVALLHDYGMYEFTIIVRK